MRSPSLAALTEKLLLYVHVALGTPPLAARATLIPPGVGVGVGFAPALRSEERRVGKECGNRLSISTFIIKVVMLAKENCVHTWLFTVRALRGTSVQVEAVQYVT